MLFEIFVAQIFIFADYCGNMLGFDGKVVYVGYDGFYRKTVETVFGKKNYVL